MNAEDLALEARRARRRMEATKRQYLAGSAPYATLAKEAQAFCDAFYAYQVARFGAAVARKMNYRSVIR